MSWNTLPKIAVLASSLLLVAGCISYRAGVWQGLVGTDAATEQAVKSKPEAGANSEPMFMSGTKSLITGNFPAAPQPARPAQAPQTTEHR